MRIVDQRHGYTYEFAPSPHAHLAEYDAEEEHLRGRREVKRGPSRFHVDGFIRWCEQCDKEVRHRYECKWSYRWRLWEHLDCGGDILMRKDPARAR